MLGWAYISFILPHITFGVPSVYKMNARRPTYN